MLAESKTHPAASARVSVDRQVVVAVALRATPVLRFTSISRFAQRSGYSSW
jgi:hypothetical protein